MEEKRKLMLQLFARMLANATQEEMSDFYVWLDEDEEAVDYLMEELQAAGVNPDEL